MVQHVLPKGFKRIRYYGVQATKTFAKVKAVIHAALAKVEGVGKGAVKIIARLTYRQRYEQSTGRDPFRCPHCGAEMAVWRIWHPKYGVIYDEGEVIKRGTYTSTAQRAGPCRQADIPQVRPEGVMCRLRVCHLSTDESGTAARGDSPPRYVGGYLCSAYLCSGAPVGFLVLLTGI